MKKIVSLIVAVVLAITLLPMLLVLPVEAAATPGVQYRSYVQKQGWEKTWSKNGSVSGTTGLSRRIETIQVKLINQPTTGGIKYRTYVQSHGWTSWMSNGGKAGTTGEAKRIESMQIKLTGNMANKYDVYYRVYAQSYGWLAWAKNGASAGTQGLAKRIESYQIVLVKKGGAKPGNVGGYKSAKSEALVTKKSLNKEAHAAYVSLIQTIDNSTTEEEQYNSYYSWRLMDLDNDGIEEFFIDSHKYQFNGIYTFSNGNYKLLTDYTLYKAADGSWWSYLMDVNDSYAAVLAPYNKVGNKMVEGNLRVVCGGRDKHIVTAYFNGVAIADGLDAVNAVLDKYGFVITLTPYEKYFDDDIIDADGAMYWAWDNTWTYNVSFDVNDKYVYPVPREYASGASAAKSVISYLKNN